MRFFNRVFGRFAQRFSGIHSREEFQLVLDRERARADRGRTTFSLVVFDFGNMGGPSGSSLVPEHLTRVLLRRIRITDAVGWFDETSIGTVLPGTTGEGAWKFADDIRKKTSAIASHISYRVYTYPVEGTADREDSFGRGRPREIPRQQGQVLFQGFGSGSPAASAAHALPTPVKSAIPIRSVARPVEDAEILFTRPMPMWKRGFDLLGATVGLIFFAPLMGIVSLAIKVGSPGSVIFRQMRAGLGGRSFWLYKFRTMVVGAETKKKDLMELNEQDGPAFKIKNDPRVTRVGSFLRKTSIDELPQLWNVLKGDMSLVGPRPLPVEESAECNPWQRKRLEITPGITCIWQVRGRSKVTFAEWCRMDIQYVREGRLFHDIKILAQTLPSVLFRRGAR